MTGNFALRHKIAAWLVHLYTASGGIIGMAALFVAADRQPRLAFLLLTITMLIDGTDGILARRARVSQVLPHFNGAEVDNIVDFLTYIWVPVFIIGMENLLPHPLWVVMPVLAALYAYGQVNMKTPDNFFLGFPSYWSIVALYMYWLRPEPVPAVLMVAIPSIFTFIPTRYLYPSKNRILWRTSWLLGALWFWLVLVLLSQEQPSPTLVWLSLYYPIYYLVVSFYIDWKIRHQEARWTR